MRQAVDPGAATQGRAPALPLVAALFFGALALRPQISDVAPLLPEISREFSLSHTAAGLLTTIPVVCMGLFAFSAASLFSVVGPRASVALALLLIATAGALRALAADAIVLIALTTLFGVGAGIAGALFPAIVRSSLADLPALATGIYSVGINGGAGLGAALAVPLAIATGSWRGTFALIALAATLSLAAWLALTHGRLPKQPPAGAVSPAIPWRRWDAWLLAVVFGLQGVCFYGLNAWLANAFIERGWPVLEAGWLVAALNFVTLPATLLVATLGDRIPRPAYLVGASLLLFLATLGISALPDAAWLWTVMAGLACGSTFPLALTLSVEVAATPREAGAVAGLMLGFGYLMSALAPVGFGSSRDLTGSFAAGFWLLAGIAALLVAASLVLLAHLARARR